MFNFKAMNAGMKVITVGLVIMLIGFFVSLFGKRSGDQFVQEVGILIFVFSFAIAGLGIFMHLYSAVVKWIAEIRNRQN